MKKLLTGLLLCFGIIAHCQVIVNVQLPPAGLCVKNQLWSLSLVNAFPTATMVQVEMVMTDVANGQRVLSGVSKFFPLERGVKLVQVSDVTPVIYNTGSSGYNVDASPDGFLPVGSFNVCYVVSRMNGDAIERISEECETVDIEPLSPSQLVMPSDSDCVELSRPLFTWLPPSPYNLFNNLVYDWLLAEIQGTQTGADAIQQNIPVFSQQNIAFTNFQYPLSAPALDTSKKYAWRVTAKSNLLPVASSDVWTFRMNCAPAEPVIVVAPPPYLKVKKEEDGSIGIFKGVLRFEYLNEVNDSLIHFSVTDITGAGRRTIEMDSTQLKLHFGQNFLVIDLLKNKQMRDKNIYLLELVNSKKEKWYLKFEYRTAD